MSTARILLRYKGILYRLIRYEASYDGSILAFVDRDRRLADGTVAPNAKPGARFSIHTSGVVHRYHKGRREGTIYISPLYDLSRPIAVGIVSIPNLSRLDEFSAVNHPADMIATLEFPETFDGRANFSIIMSPKGHPLAADTFGAAFNYEIYSVATIIERGVEWPRELNNHFIYGLPSRGEFDSAQVTSNEAELRFYKTAYPDVPPIFREKSGAYVIHAKGLMRIAPKLSVGFSRDDLSIEQINFENKNTQPTHKVRFWILDKGGRNKVDDLRSYILSAWLNAEL